MPTSTEVERLAKRYGALIREPSPWDSQYVHALSVKIQPYENDLLRRLRTKYRDEREWASMLSFHMVRGPVEHLLTGILADGFDIVGGKSLAAQRLTAAAERMVQLLPQADWQSLIQVYSVMPWFGWQPMQIEVAQSRVGGASWWVPSKIQDMPPERVRWTDEDEPRLVYIRRTSKPPVLIDAEASRYFWLTPRRGGLRTPYGTPRAASHWALWRIASALTEKGYEAPAREWRMLRVKTDAQAPAGGAAGVSSRAWTSSQMRDLLDGLKEDIKIIMQLAHEKNVLIETPGIRTEFDQGAGLITGVRDLLQHLETTLRVDIEGQHLTANTSEAGPAGSSQTSERVMKGYGLTWIGEGVESSTTQLFRQIIELNEGEVDPADLPSYVSRARSRIKTEDVMKFWTMGGTFGLRAAAERVGGQALAEIFGTEEEIEAEGDIPVTKQRPSPPSPQLPPPQQSSPQGPPGAPEVPDALEAPARSTRDSNSDAGAARLQREAAAADEISAPLRRRIDAEIARQLSRRPPKV